jgi:hypothetical protein
MSSHRIRLAGPWEWQPLPETNGIASTSLVHRCQLPFPSEHDGVARDGLLLRRRFHCPTGIEVSTFVAVTLEVQHCIPDVRLNERILTPVEDRAIPNLWRFEVSGFLKPFNELQVHLHALHPDSQPRLNAAGLEIHEPE